MIKIIDDKNTIIVDFIDTSKGSMSGKLLTYEIYGDACISVGEDRIWVPFSHLTPKSQNEVLALGDQVKNNTDTLLSKEPKVVIIITILVLIVFSYYYSHFNI